MSDRKDILLSDDNDLQIQNGDFLIGLSDVQHVDHIVTAQLGEYKEFPNVGFGVQTYLKTKTREVRFKRDLRVQLNYDGYDNPEIDLKEGFKKLKVKL